MTSAEIIEKINVLDRGVHSDIGSLLKKCLSGVFELNDGQDSFIIDWVRFRFQAGNSANAFETNLMVVTICNFIVLNGKRIPAPTTFPALT